MFLYYNYLFLIDVILIYDYCYLFTDWISVFFHDYILLIDNRQDSPKFFVIFMYIDIVWQVY